MSSRDWLAALVGLGVALFVALVALRMAVWLVSF